MKRVADFVIKYRHVFTGIFLALVIACAAMIPFVETNYDMTKYLDGSAPSVVSLDKMEEQFGSVGTAQLMVKNVSESEARAIQTDILGVPGVSAVAFDAADESSYKDGNALYKIFLETGNYEVETDAVIDGIRAVLAERDIAMNGGAVQSQYLRTGVSGDMLIILAVALVIVFGILLLTSNSWADVLLFAVVVAGSLIINLGTNLFLGEISFVTKSICAVMQLALAMDYSIILLHRFDEEMDKGLNEREAISTALAKTFAPVSASSLTTVAGLVALMFMQFTIGFDIGMVLAKGVIISLLCVFFFMPAFVLMFSKLIQKSKHKSVYAAVKERSQRRREARAVRFAAYNAQNPAKRPKSIHTLADLQNSSKIAVSLALAALIVAGCVVQTDLQYSYVIDTSKYANAAINVENAEITAAFGTQNPFVVLVPQGDAEKEQQLTEMLLAYTYNGEKVINSAQSAADMGLYTDIGGLAPQAGEYAAQVLLAPGNFLSGIVSAQVQNVVQELCAQLEQWMEEDGYALLTEGKLTLFDAVSYAAQRDFFHNRADDLRSLLEANAGTADLAVTLFRSTMETQYTAASFAQTYAEYGVTAAQASSLWAALGAGEGESLAYAKIAEEAANSGIFSENGQYGAVVSAQSALYSLVGGNIDLLPILSAALENAQTQNELQAAAESLYRQISMFNNGEYSRLVFNLDLPISSDAAFAAVEQLHAAIAGLYPESYIVCESYNYLDIKTSFEGDTVVVNLISFFAIFLIILITFRSLSIPVLLTVLIQGAIWVSSAINVLMGAPMFFVAFIVVMCIQMGATVDYAILMTDRYMAARQSMGKKESIAAAFDASIITILTSGSILVVAAFVVGIISRVAIISTIGYLLSRGCLISVLFVILALPQLLLLSDPVIRKTTLGGGKMLAERREKRVRRAPLSASEGGSEQANAPESAPTEEK